MFAYLQELGEDGLRGVGSVLIPQLVMPDAHLPTPNTTQRPQQLKGKVQRVDGKSPLLCII